MGQIDMKASPPHQLQEFIGDEILAGPIGHEAEFFVVRQRGR